MPAQSKKSRNEETPSLYSVEINRYPELSLKGLRIFQNNCVRYEPQTSGTKLEDQSYYVTSPRRNGQSAD
jgi:hypothetical protein